MTDAMTDPRPRVTNRIGSAQHTSVVTALVSPTTVLKRSRRISLLPTTDWTRTEMRPHTDHLRAETPRRSLSLDQQDGEEEMFWNGRDGKWDECAPLLECRHRDGDDEACRGRERRHIRQNERRPGEGRLTTVRRSSAAVIRLHLCNVVLRARAGWLGVVHRAAGPVVAARHPSLRRVLPSGADGEIAETQHQNQSG
jgi:hypothetical protein